MTELVPKSPKSPKICNHGLSRYIAILQTHSKPLMGRIADALRRDLEAMRARHAESDRRIAELITSTHELIAETEKMLAEDRPQ